MRETTQVFISSILKNAYPFLHIADNKKPMLYGLIFVVLLIQVIFIILLYKTARDRGRTVNFIEKSGDNHQKNLADEIMQRQKLSYEALFKNSTDAIIRFDHNHNVIDINERFTELFGYTGL